MFIFGKNFTTSPTVNVNSVPVITKQYTMNYFDPGENSNKVWIGMAFDNGLFETKFGRVRDGANLVKKEKKFASKIEAERELEKKTAGKATERL